MLTKYACHGLISSHANFCNIRIMRTKFTSKVLQVGEKEKRTRFLLFLFVMTEIIWET